MKDLGKMMKQVQEMQSKMQDMQNELSELQVEGASGAGMVTLALSGKGEMKALKIDPSLMNAEEKEVLEDLILAAHNDAKRKLEAEMEEKMGQITGGLPLPPGFKLPI